MYHWVYCLARYDVIKKKKNFIYEHSLFIPKVDETVFNYITTLFYNKYMVLKYLDNVEHKLAVRKFKYKLGKRRNFIYYSRRLQYEIKSIRSTVQLTSRYRNKFFTFLKKKLQFNLSVGRVFFWKLKKTATGRIVNFYNTFFRLVIPFLSKKFIFLLYNIYNDWTSDFQKFSKSIYKAKKRRRIRRLYSFFKILVYPKLGFGYMRSPKYPIRKRFLQRRRL